MNQLMFFSLSPLLIVSFGTVLSLLLIAWRRSQKLILVFSLIIFSVAFICCCSLIVNLADPVQITQLIKVDNYAIFAFMMVLVASMVVALLSSSWLTHSVEVHDEFYILLQLVVLGAGILVASDHFASLFLGFELLSISLVGMVGYSRDNQYSVESSFKYLILSASASSFMLLGIAFIYSQSGSLSFASDLFAMEHVANEGSNQFYHAGLLLFLVGIAFKLSLAPFHLWTPDVYQGAPTPVTLLLATVSKVAMFIILMKFWFSQSAFLTTENSMTSVGNLISTFAILSMLIGNALALKQQNIKRLLAYSSIAHMGYLLIVLMIVFPQGMDLAWQSVLFYLCAYVLATLSLFMALQLSQAKGVEMDMHVSDWQGMFWHSRLLALLIITAILSLAGIPLTMGFIGKFYILNVAVQAQQWWLIASLIIGSGIGLFYYLRIIFVLFEGVNEGENSSGLSFTISPSAKVAAVLSIATGLVLGVFPDFLTKLIFIL